MDFGIFQMISTHSESLGPDSRMGYSLFEKFWSDLASMAPKPVRTGCNPYGNLDGRHRKYPSLSCPNYFRTGCRMWMSPRDDQILHLHPRSWASGTDCGRPPSSPKPPLQCWSSFSTRSTRSRNPALKPFYGGFKKLDLGSLSGLQYGTVH